ncbi:multicopper oxidase family protein [Pseudodonghicola flavimaris]|uniref:Multicopper oxidase family protein n=1 Tax=Pseudodonghicola flavimaris TaxID=3050036 RepID=A0ABT7F1Y9_9RHOB|nr:multicopper oxidase family protein [Pseudodonghicola flavimaris]MDK3018618.1 multicopper oxidase family protein [Pseudodonghicola flavimaris]
MTVRVTRRAFGTGAMAAAALGATQLRAAAPTALTARVSTAQIAPRGYPATEVWSYDGGLPGPVLRVPQGGRLRRRLVNDLPVPTSVHWHGIRIDNAMDGVAGLTQQPVPPGATFDYDFAVPDAGTFWYHAHTNSMEQVARGLAGALIVEEAEPPEVDRDEVVLLDDWLLDPADAQLMTPFGHPMSLSHAGRTGNLLGANGSYDCVLPVRRHERLRLRLINGANARIFVLRLRGMNGWTAALDGMPLPGPEPVTGEMILAPAQRLDLIVDVTAETGEAAALLHLERDGSTQPLMRLPVAGTAAVRAREAPAALPPNPRMAVSGLDTARRLEMAMEGGAMAGLVSARFEGRDMGFRDLARRGQFWALAGQVGMTDAPFARLDRGETVRLKLTNSTVFAHAMHLHGMHFREVRGDGSLGPLRDTIVSVPDEPLEIAFVADNPGRWLFHCHMLAHAAAGMTTWIEVA